MKIINKKVNKKIELKHKTNKGKSIISNKTDWILKFKNEKVICLDEKPGFLLESDNFWMWILQKDDKDFEII